MTPPPLLGRESFRRHFESYSGQGTTVNWAADPAINQHYNQDYKCRVYENTEQARLYNAGGEFA